MKFQKNSSFSSFELQILLHMYLLFTSKLVLNIVFSLTKSFALQSSRGGERKISLVFTTESYFAVPKILD